MQRVEQSYAELFFVQQELLTCFARPESLSLLNITHFASNRERQLDTDDHFLCLISPSNNERTGAMAIYPGGAQTRIGRSGIKSFSVTNLGAFLEVCAILLE